MTELNQGFPRWLGVVLIAAGVALYIPIVFRDLPLAATGTHTTGVIERLPQRRRESPLVRFTTAAGSEVTFKGFQTQFELGQRVPVIYREADPKGAQIYSWRTFWLGVTFVMVLGAAMIAGGIRIVRPAR